MPQTTERPPSLHEAEVSPDFKFNELWARLRTSQAQMEQEMPALASDEDRTRAISNYQQKLYKRLGEVEKLNIPDYNKHLYNSVILTELARVDFATKTEEELGHLTPATLLSRWQHEAAEFVVETNKNNSAEHAKSRLRAFWDTEKEILSAPFFKERGESRQAQFETYKQGILAAAAIEQSVESMKGWTIVPSTPKDDAKHAIDLIAISERGNYFFLQIKSDARDRAAPITTEVITGDQRLPASQKSRARFQRGVATYLNKPAMSNVRPEDIRAVYITVASRLVNPDNGMPESDVDYEIFKALDSIDERDVRWA